MGEIACAVAVAGRYKASRENLRLVGGAGIERVELHFCEGNVEHGREGAVEEVADALGEAGVECRSVHLGFEPCYDLSSKNEGERLATVEDMKAAIAKAPVVGAQIVVVHGSDEPVADWERGERKEILKESLVDITEAAGEAGVRVALELLPRTCLGNTSGEALEIVEGLGEELIGFCVDVNHVNLREDPAEVVRRLAGRIVSFHVSDNDGVDERHWFPFEGVIDWEAFMWAVREVGYEGQFVFETGGSLGEDVAAYLREVRRRFERLLEI